MEIEDAGRDDDAATVPARRGGGGHGGPDPEDRLGGGGRTALSGGGGAAGRQLLAAGADRRRCRDVPAALPDRGHAAAAHPERPEAVAFARRPGTFALVIDCPRGRGGAAAFAGRPAFLRHGAFTADGALLFTAENAIAEGTGRLGIWDAADAYKRIGEVPTGGSGPHEVRLMPDGARFAVANGGIETDPASGGAELNLATMRSNLAYLDAGSGEVTDVLELPEALRLLSIRHIAAGRDGTLAAAMQWQGSALETPPLLAVRRPGRRGWSCWRRSPRCSGTRGTMPAAWRSATTGGGRRSRRRGAT